MVVLNDAQTNNHFGGRPIFGIVTSFTRCSDAPGPNMEMLPPCLNIPITSPAPQPTVAASASGNAPPLSPPQTLANNKVQNPECNFRLYSNHPIHVFLQIYFSANLINFSL